MLQAQTQSLVTAKLGVEVDYPRYDGAFTYCGLTSPTTCPGQVHGMQYALLIIKTRCGIVTGEQRIFIGTHFYKGTRLALPGSKYDTDGKYLGPERKPVVIRLPALGPNRDPYCFEPKSFSEDALVGWWHTP